KLAQNMGIRQIELQGQVPQELLFDICDSALGSSNWLYREQDDEDIDVCVPGPEWLGAVFRTTSLAWLLEIEETPISWNKYSLYVFPGNPPDWDVEVPINARLLQVVRANESRPCPMCGTDYVCKRDDRCQCPHCAYIAMPFATKEHAKHVELAPL